MAERDKATISVMGSQRARLRFGEHAHRAALAHLRLLLDVEANPFHVRQYDLRRKQPVHHLGRCFEVLELHRFLDRQGSVCSADKASEITADTKALAEVAGDRA